MTAQKQSQIAPPPSLDDILSGDTTQRLGSVDFTARLAPEVEAVAAPKPDPKPLPTRAKAPVAGPDARARIVEAAEDVEEAEEGPLILPVAHLVEVEPEVDAEPEVAVVAEPEPEPEVDAEPELQIELDDEVDEVDEVEEEPTAEPDDEALVEILDAWPHEDPAPVDMLPVDAVSVDAVSVDAVAATVIARMRATEDAARRHLEAIEAEAARRCELVTAQAELDAELIRLHARREAHAIIAAARTRAGGGTGSVRESQRLHEIGETFARFAESLETTVAPATGTPDTPQKP